MDAGPLLGGDLPSGLLPVVVPGKKSLMKIADAPDAAKTVGANLSERAVDDTAHKPMMLFDDEEGDSILWFYSQCLIACCAAGANFAPLKVATKFMRSLKSAFYGHVRLAPNSS